MGSSIGMLPILIPISIPVSDFLSVMVLQYIALSMNHQPSTAIEQSGNGIIMFVTQA